MAKIATNINSSDALILETLSPDIGSSVSWLLEELDMSESALKRHISKLRILGLVRRHFDTEGDLMIYRTPKGDKMLEKSNRDNPKGVEKVPNLKIGDKELVDDIKEIAENEGKSVTEFLGDLLDESYPVVEDEEEEEEEK